MLYVESTEEAQVLSRRTLELMAQQDIPANPANFTLWYSYFIGSPPELKAAVDQIWDERGAIDAELSRDLYARFLGENDPGRHIVEASSAIEEKINQLLKYVEQSTENTDGFGKKMADLSGDLVRGLEKGDAVEVVRRILLETQNVVAKGKALEKKLSESTEEVHRLRENLNAVRHEAWTDGLTGIANRKCFDVGLEEAAATARAEKTPLSLLLADIDRFKKFNDTYGHRIGDQVLRLVAQSLKDGVKGADLPARYGGEEFAIVLPETERGNAAILANNLRDRLARKELKNIRTDALYGRITISVGVAQYRPGEPLAELVQRADEALYEAKAAGRDCVMTEADLRPGAVRKQAG
ncbi:MAG TPA: GGDEF domain-containing protein [Kiloniellaceae bacterium]|nr:GGDEF domain-containing protein [Kiloniellaceae bacterium]